MRWTLTLADDEAPPVDEAPPPEGGDGEDTEDECPEGQHLDPETGECVDDEPTDEAPDEETPEGEAPAPPVAASTMGRFTAVLIPEGVESGDGRMVQQGALTWRDLPLPLMGLDATTAEHEQAVVIGSIDTIERVGSEIHGSGPWAAGVDANRIRGLIRAGHLRGVSVDMDDLEYEIRMPMNEEVVEDGDELVIPMGGERMVVSAGRIMGATVVPFPAFQEAFITDLDPEVPLEGTVPALVAAVAPVRPPLEWFANPMLNAYTPLTYTDDGRVYGHAAAWDSCHLSFPGRCVSPPRSSSDYAHFHTGEVVCDDGVRVAVGHIAVKGGHAPLDVSAAAAQAHYDDTDSCVADVCVGEDRHGIWVAGALRPSATPEQVRAAMASGVSGDWRRIGGTLELIHLSSVNVPGFLKPRARVRERAGLVASLIVNLPPLPAGMDDRTFTVVSDSLAQRIGADDRSRIARLSARAGV